MDQREEASRPIRAKCAKCGTEFESPLSTRDCSRCTRTAELAARLGRWTQPFPRLMLGGGAIAFAIVGALGTVYSLIDLVMHAGTTGPIDAEPSRLIASLAISMLLVLSKCGLALGARSMAMGAPLIFLAVGGFVLMLAVRLGLEFGLFDLVGVQGAIPLVEILNFSAMVAGVAGSIAFAGCGAYLLVSIGALRRTAIISIPVAVLLLELAARLVPRLFDRFVAGAESYALPIAAITAWICGLSVVAVIAVIWLLLAREVSRQAARMRSNAAGLD